MVAERLEYVRAGPGDGGFDCWLSIGNGGVLCGGVSGVPKRTGVWNVAAGMVADLVDEYPPERCMSSRRSIR